MESGGFLKNSQIIILGVCIAAATIISSTILSQGFLKIMKFKQEQISVTGSATKEIKSDYIIWTGSFSRREADMAAAYRKLQEDLEKVKKYLSANGVNEKEIIISQVTTGKIYKKNDKGNDTNDIQWYELSQSIEIRSNDVDKIARVSRESTELINQGVEFDSGAPSYFYTKLDELKLEMLARASENAKQRAENMVKAAGNKIGLMRSAKMGVFQITPITSTDVSDWGCNDTTSLDKKVMAVVSASFAIE
ncbi:MAG: SIMPL domain-containing protein [Candidatus Omnitrophota bacterium]